MKYKEHRALWEDDLRNLCIAMGWYTRGTCADYEGLFSKLWDLKNERHANMTPARLAGIAQDIKDHSDTDYNVQQIMSSLARKCISSFIQY